MLCLALLGRRPQKQPWCPLPCHPPRRLMVPLLSWQWQQQQMCQLSKPLRYLLLLLLLSMMIIVILPLVMAALLIMVASQVLAAQMAVC